VQGIQVPAAGEPAADVLIDLPRRHAPGVQAADHHRLLGPGRGGLVALERHADELVAQLQRVDDLRRRRQQ
jgi:hypothetical protein